MGTRTIIPGSNNAGQIGSDTKYWDKGFFNTLHVNDLHTASSSTLSASGISITNTAGIIFEGATANEFETQLTAADPSADRVIILPDSSGTVSLSDTTYSAGTLLDLSTTTFNVDLTEAAAATIAAGDNIIFLDGGASGTASKGSINDVATLFAGTASATGLSASSGVLSVSDLHPVGVDGSANQLLTDDGDGTVTSESKLKFDSNTLTVGDGSDSLYVIGVGDVSDDHGSRLYLLSGNGNGTDKNGGNFTFYSGRPTGNATPGGFSWSGSLQNASSGDTLRSDAAWMGLKGDTLTTYLTIYSEGGASLSDYLKVSVAEHGATEILTLDAAATAAHLTMDIDGDIIHDPHTGISKWYKAGNTSDYLQLEIGSNGDATFTTVDAASHAADITISADGDITLTTLNSQHSTSIKRRKMTVSSSTDNDHDGDVVYFGTGSTTLGEICFLDTDGSNNPVWTAAQANAESTSTYLLAIALGTTPATDGMLLRGMFTLDHNTGDNNYGTPVYLSDSVAGNTTSTAPSDNNDVVRVVGYKMGNDDEIWFCPDNTWVVVSA
tara:strand:- start:1590 stop:3248 length:1659 start_codon:yes stop_codon:yes gene_type:complete